MPVAEQGAFSRQRQAVYELDPREEKAIERGCELLKLCVQLQSEKDGVNRVLPGVFDKAKVLDQVAQDAGEASLYMLMLRKLLPMQEQLAELGRTLEGAGRLKVMYGENYAERALEFVIEQCGLAGATTLNADRANK